MVQERKAGEKKTAEKAHVTEVCEEEIDFALATEHREDLSEFTKEALNCAALVALVQLQEKYGYKFTEKS